MGRIYLLGPQRPDVNLDKPFAELPSDGQVAVISAGWQEAEGDIDDLRAIVGRNLTDLRLYQRAEELFAKDKVLRDRYRQRQDRLQELQRVHRIRLRQAMLAARRLLREEADEKILLHERRHAITQLRSLDRHHARSIAAIHREYDSVLKERPSDRLARHTQQIADVVARCDTVMVTGGNVTVLLNRLKLFGLGDLLRDRTIVAWSAGAMALAETIVLFHDRTPLENRDAEIMDCGLGLVAGAVLLPDARHRLKQNDRVRVGLFSRRFAPAACLTLDNGSILQYRNGRLESAAGARKLMRSGTIRRVKTGEH